MRTCFLLAALLVAACAETEPQARHDPEAVAAFLENHQQPKTAEIERRIDIEQSDAALRQAPLTRSEDVARELAERSK